MPISRRSVVIAGSGSLLLAGCSTGPLRQSHHHGSTDPDPFLFRLATGDVLRMHSVVAKTIQRHPGLRAMLGPLRELHREHLDTMLNALSGPRGTVGAVTTAIHVPHSGRRALADVTGAESRLTRHLAGYAQQVDSGDLARLLASMAAAVRQRLADLPGGAP